jgi:hypothetical protein
MVVLNPVFVLDLRAGFKIGSSGIAVFAQLSRVTLRNRLSGGARSLTKMSSQVRGKWYLNRVRANCIHWKKKYFN